MRPAPAPADDEEELATCLARFLADQLRVQDVRISGLARIAGGSSRENWRFAARWRDAGEADGADLLLRRDPRRGVVDTGRLVEFQLLQALEDTVVPAPRVVALDETGEVFSRPAMVVRLDPGRAHRAALRTSDPLKLGKKGRLRLARAICGTLADIHRTDLDATGIAGCLPVPQTEPAHDEMTYWRGRLAEVSVEPQPALELAARSLSGRVPAAPDRLVLVHGDLRPANVLVHRGRLSVLLDWELARLGDAHDDLGWYLAHVYRREHFIPGAWDEASFLASYEEASGIEVDPDALQFWRGMAAFRLAVMALTAATAFARGESDRPVGPAGATVRRLATHVVRGSGGVV